VGKAFTLLEAVVTVAVLVIIASSLTMVFRTLLSSWNKTETVNDVSQSAYAVLDQMSRELKCIVKDPDDKYYLWGIDKDSANHISQTASDEIYFVTAVKGSAGTGLCEVGYWLKDSGDDKDNSLMRHVKDNISGITDFTTSVLPSTSSQAATNVTKFEVLYWNTNTAAWESDPAQPTDALKEWNLNNQLPVAVKIALSMTDDKNKNEAKFEKVVFLRASQ
jgi:type II secretory pathway pseudopilin PulG